MKKVLLAMCIVCGATAASAQNFNDYFEDRTLRIDYDFTGDVNKQEISVIRLNAIPRWYGKRQNLAEVPTAGNGDITVRSKDGRVIYKTSFSTLFQEGLAYPEAKQVRKSFENVFLLPMPKDTVDVTVELRTSRLDVLVSYTHRVIPSDILIKHIGEKEVTPYKTLMQAADTNKCMHIAYIAEGYRKEDMDDFIAHATEANEALFAHEPFKSLKGRFNVIAVMSESKESGTSVPSKGVWKNTVLGSHFDTFYSDRYLTTLNLRDMHDQLAGTPYEHIIVLVNSETYGGGGIYNSYNLTSTRHKYFKPVVVHEFGHSIAGLGDEYAFEEELIPLYPHDIEPWEPNLTTLVDFHSKWEDLVKKGTKIPTIPTEKNKMEVGVYEGAGYSVKGVYRAFQDCRMRTNQFPEFCPVCKRALTHLIDFYTK